MSVGVIFFAANRSAVPVVVLVRWASVLLASYAAEHPGNVEKNSERVGGEATAVWATMHSPKN